MKFVSALVVLAAFAAADAQSSFKLDGHEIQQVLADDKLYHQYFNCVMDKGKCTPDGQDLKDHIPDHLNGGCANCTPERKERAKTLVRFMVAKKNNDFEEFEKKYDPKHMMRKQYGQ
ncbi:unnamed protein product [Nezara viridula]|uniref:Uncharacterized protein n=1 Tax=Nezara viridula TaxID=85310 RepID=A0A9P0H420_NEZVI|nr:unnamed protein product [Nezara viridula]